MVINHDLQVSLNTLRAQLLRASSASLILDTMLSKDNFTSAMQALEVVHASIERAINEKDTIYERVRGEIEERSSSSWRMVLRSMERARVIPLKVTYELPYRYIGIELCMLATREEEENCFNRSEWLQLPLLQERLNKDVPGARIIVVHHIERKPKR